MYLLYYVFTLLVHIAAPQFPAHVDLQKVTDITYKNESYKILKPTVHTITNYFEEFVLRSETRKDEKIFIDNDGFRHFWGGFGKETKSLRKTDIIVYEINKNSNSAKSTEKDETHYPEEGIILSILRRKAKATTANAKQKATTTKHKAAATKRKTATTKRKTTKTKHKTATTKSKATISKAKATTIELKAAITKPRATTTKPKATTTKPNTTTATKDSSKPKEKLKHSGGKNVAITSFFCPFLGVIKMTTILD